MPRWWAVRCRSAPIRPAARSTSPSPVGPATVGFALVARSNQAIHGAISRIEHDQDRWQSALRQDGGLRQGAAVAEVGELVDLTAWPEGMRPPWAGLGEGA